MDLLRTRGRSGGGKCRHGVRAGGWLGLSCGQVSGCDAVSVRVLGSGLIEDDIPEILSVCSTSSHGFFKLAVSLGFSYGGDSLHVTFGPFTDDIFRTLLS